ncbi:hypothetical protein BJY52DRAFT_1299916 [Lactarius psammicola]|nr:hypothetical protein BJY52DRAFT_1299916 [Lactarius psammicola]
MAHYDIFRHHLVIKYPAYGHALWEPSPGDSYPAVEIGDVGFIRDGRFHRLFNALLPAEDPSHENFGVPEYHSRLTLRMKEHIISSTLSPNNFCSARVASESASRVLATGPDSPAEVAFSCRGKQGAVLSLPIQARCKNTVALGEFGEWMIKHIDCWFAWARRLGLGIDRMEDIVLVTGTHRTRSWTNVAFPRGQEDGQASRGDIVSINWKFSHEHNQGAVLNCGPNGEDLLEDQCIFIRGFRPAAGPNPDPKGYDYEPDIELTSNTCCTREEAPHCDMTLVHDDDLILLDRLGDDTTLEALQLDTLLRHLRCLKPKVHDVTFGQDPSSSSGSANTDAETLSVATLSIIFEGWSPSPTLFASSVDKLVTARQLSGRPVTVVNTRMGGGMQNLHITTSSGRAEKADLVLEQAKKLLEQHRDAVGPDSYSLASGWLVQARDYRSGLEDKGVVARYRQSLTYLKRAQEILRNIEVWCLIHHRRIGR